MFSLNLPKKICKNILHSLKNKKRKIGMDEGLHYYKPQAQKNKHINQNKAKCKFLCFEFL
jgi:hypothetical protein